ncbi:unnamed protein product [Urochloa humidicola]
MASRRTAAPPSCRAATMASRKVAAFRWEAEQAAAVMESRPVDGGAMDAHRRYPSADPRRAGRPTARQSFSLPGSLDQGREELDLEGGGGGVVRGQAARGAGRPESSRWVALWSGLDG